MQCKISKLRSTIIIFQALQDAYVLFRKPVNSEAEDKLVDAFKRTFKVGQIILLFLPHLFFLPKNDDVCLSVTYETTYPKLKQTISSPIKISGLSNWKRGRRAVFSAAGLLSHFFSSESGQDFFFFSKISVWANTTWGKNKECWNGELSFVTQNPNSFQNNCSMVPLGFSFTVYVKFGLRSDGRDQSPQINYLLSATPHLVINTENQPLLKCYWCKKVPIWSESRGIPYNSTILPAIDTTQAEEGVDYTDYSLGVTVENSWKFAPHPYRLVM